MADELIPNTFQSPNFIVDDGIMALLDGDEVKLLLAIQRRVLGWADKRAKRQDNISLSQLEEMTGLSRPTVVKKLEQLENANLIARAEQPASNSGTLWELNVGQLGPVNKDYLLDRARQRREANKRKSMALVASKNANAEDKGGSCDEPPLRDQTEQGGKPHELVNGVNQLTALTTSSKRGLPQVVNAINTQNPIKPNKPNNAKAIALASLASSASSTPQTPPKATLTPHGGEDTPAVKATGVPGDKQSTRRIRSRPPPERSQREIAVDALVALFLRETGIPLEPDYKAREKLWRNPLRRLLDASDGDAVKAQDALRRGIAAMRKQNLTIANPNSVYNVAMGEFGKLNGGARTVVLD